MDAAAVIASAPPELVREFLHRKRAESLRSAKAWLRDGSYTLPTRRAFARGFIAQARWASARLG